MNQKQLDSLFRVGQTLYRKILADGKITREEDFELLRYAQDLHEFIQDALSNQNPTKCYMGYTTGVAIAEGLKGEALKKRAIKDGYDPDLVLFLAKELRSKENPRPEMPQGRNLGYGTNNGGMARNQLRSILRASSELHDAIYDNDELPDWVLSKVTVALDRLTVARDYIISKLQGYKSNPRLSEAQIDAAIANAQATLDLACEWE